MIAKLVSFLFPVPAPNGAIDRRSFAWQWRAAVGGDVVESTSRGGSRSSARCRLPVIASWRGWVSYTLPTLQEGQNWPPGRVRHQAFWGQVELAAGLTACCVLATILAILG